MDDKIDAVMRLMREMNQLMTDRDNGKSKYFNNGRPMDNAAIKRKSMDLTRALAELRKPN